MVTSPPLRRSTRDKRMSLQAMGNYQTNDIVLTAEYYQAQEIMENVIERQMDDPIAFAAKHDPDT
eukprot:13936400-Ditylum_brightwellii.AAC.1